MQITTSLLGLGLAALIVLLLRRDHLYVHHGLFWLIVALAAGVLGVWPQLIDTLAMWLGIAYPPAALFLLAAVVLFVKALYGDLTHTRLERDVRRLNQRIALLEIQLNHHDDVSTKK